VTALRLKVHGRVQGVFYRDWTVATARELGVAGWVRNCSDGTVEAHLEGDDEAVQLMIERMRAGPPRARVERIDQEECEPEHLPGFDRR